MVTKKKFTDCHQISNAKCFEFSTFRRRVGYGNCFKSYCRFHPTFPSYFLRNCSKSIFILFSHYPKFFACFSLLASIYSKFYVVCSVPSLSHSLINYIITKRAKERLHVISNSRVNMYVTEKTFFLKLDTQPNNHNSTVLVILGK